MEDSRSQQLSLSSPNNNPLVTALVGKLSEFREVDDLKYHISWVYGGYIEDIPKRIGRNEALDTAVTALLSTHSALRLRKESNRPIAVEVFQKYSHAIKTLREYLDIPARAREVDTLCAVSLLLICSSFFGTQGNRSYHGEGAAQILKARTYYDPKDDFEQKLLLCLRGPVLFEALVNPRIKFTTEEWKTLVENKLDENNRPEGLMLRCLGRAPSLMHRGKIALREQTGLQMLVSEARHEYQTLTTILSDLHDRYTATQETGSAGTVVHTPMSAFTVAMISCHYQRSYGIGLTMCMIFNSILLALDTNNMDLNEDAKHFYKEALKLADDAAKYRPLCAGYLYLCLSAAWSCNENKDSRATLERLIAEYASDFGMSSKEMIRRNLEEATRSLRLMDP